MSRLLFFQFDSTAAPSVTVLDNYKAKVLRGMLPPPYNSDYTSTIGTLVTTIGRSDNFIGGLFGSADFLPDNV